MLGTRGGFRAVGAGLALVAVAVGVSVAWANLTQVPVKTQKNPIREGYSAVSAKLFRLGAVQQAQAVFLQRLRAGDVEWVTHRGGHSRQRGWFAGLSRGYLKHAAGLPADHQWPV